MEIERRFYELTDIKLEERAEGDGTAPQICGYGAVFNKLSGNLGGFREQIAPGAFDEVLTDDVRALFNHDPNHILGRTLAGTLRLFVDATGLGYEIDPPDTQAGRDLVISMKRGDVNQSSFAFTVEDDDWSEDDDGRIVRTIKKIRRLYDVSPVTYPAYPDASAAVRSMEAWRDQSIRHHAEQLDEMERRLRLQEVS